MLSEAQLARLLLDEDRLAILGRAGQSPCTIDEMAAVISGKRSSLARHLAQLTEAGLLTVSDGPGQERYALDIQTIRTMKQALFARPELPETATSDDKVLAAFVRDERLTHYPVQHSKRMVVLRWLVERFDPERTYTEAEINDLLSGQGEDHATLRRYLVDAGLMERSHGLYRRTGLTVEEPQL